MASYNIMSSGRRGWSTQSWLLFIYSAVVTFALVLVVSRNFETPEQIVAEERLEAEGKRENAEQQAVAKMAVPEVYEGESDGCLLYTSIYAVGFIAVGGRLDVFHLRFGNVFFQRAAVEACKAR